MAESTGFTHITVTPDEDDDIVIQAGIIADEPSADELPAETSDGDALPDDALPDEVVADEAVADAVREKGEEPAPASAPRAPKPDNGYRETSLEDLQDVKMSTTQKVVIVLAALGIVAFVAWYLFAR